jgi:adenine-specific DNA-methyltransferase
MARYRQRDPLLYFRAKLSDLADLAPSSREHVIMTGDARQMLDHDALQGCAAAYIDPPYSAVHYSRFYHVLEELCSYDYPPVYFGGRFPADRYVSPYSIRRDALGEISGLLDTIAQRGCPVVISYGSRGLVSEAALVHACQKAFGTAGIVFRKVPARHASMGRADRGAQRTTELLITCTPRARSRPASAATGRREAA